MTGQMKKLTGKCPVTDCYVSTDKASKINTLEPLNSGHTWDPTVVLLCREVILFGGVNFRLSFERFILPWDWSVLLLEAPLCIVGTQARSMIVT